MLALLIILVVMPLMPVIGCCPLARRGEAVCLAVEVILLDLVLAMVEVMLLNLVLHKTSREAVCKPHFLLVGSLLLP